MPVGEITGGALGTVARVIGYIFGELILEILIQGTGRLVLNALRPRREPGEVESAFVGLLVWAVVIGAAFWLFG